MSGPLFYMENTLLATLQLFRYTELRIFWKGTTL